MSEAEGSPLPKSRGDAEGSRRAITFFKRSDFSAVGAARSWNKGPCPLVWKYGRSESSHMKTRLSVIAAVGALAVAIAAQSQLVREQSSGKSIALQDISVIPMDTERVLSHHTVLVRNGKIADVGPSNSVNLPPGTVVIDGRDKFLMPGMADMHTHVDRKAMLPLFLAAGVTTVLNMGTASPEFVTAARDEIRRGSVVGPRVLAAFMIDGPGDPGPEYVALCERDARAAGSDQGRFGSPKPGQATG